MKTIELNELKNYIDPFSYEKEPAIAMACDGKETNGLTIGWLSLGILWRKPCATVYIHKDRYSKHIFDTAEYFSVNFPKEENKEVLKYFGSVSGRDEDKIKECGLAMAEDSAPYFADNRVTIICRTMGRSDFDVSDVDEGVKAWYERAGVHSQYYGEIVKIIVNE